MTLWQLYRQTQAALNTDNAAFEARQLLMFACKTDQTAFLLNRERQADDVEIRLVNQCVSRRNSGEPLYYIIGSAEFYSLEFEVTKDTLIPRQDSELIVDLALDFAKRRTITRACDLCSGSGAIGIAFCVNSGIPTDCVELYPGACAVLERNIKAHNAPATAVSADALTHDLSKYQLITCNPPYIAESERAELSAEVLSEPHTALFAPDGGLMFYRVISKNVKSGAHIIFETGYEQTQSVSDILQSAGFTDIAVHRDLCGKPRAVEGTKI